MCTGQLLYIVFLGHNKGLLDFGDLDLVSMSPSYKNCKNQPFGTLSFKPAGGFLPNLYRYFVGEVERAGSILVTLTLFSSSHQHQIGFPYDSS